jgi:hypothetical protein
MTVDIADKRQARFDWIGLSGDPKPTTGLYGSTFYETDTYCMFVYSAAGWTLKKVLVHDSDVLPAIPGSVAAVGVLLSCDTSGYETVSLQLKGTWVGTVLLQASNDNSTWVQVLGFSGATELSAVDQVTENGLILVPCVGRYFRAYVSQLISGTVEMVAYLRNESIAGVGVSKLTLAMDQGTYIPMNTAPMGLTQPGAQPVARAVPVALANEQFYDAIIQGALRLGGLNTNLLHPDANSVMGLDCLAYRSVHIQVNSLATTTGGVYFECSNDGVNWIAATLFDYNSGTGLPVTGMTFSASVPRFFTGAIAMRYFRARVYLAVAVAPAQAITRLSMAPFTRTDNTINLTSFGGVNLVNAGLAGLLAVGGNVAPGAAAIGYPMPISGVDRTGLTRRVLTDPQGNLVSVGPDPQQAGVAPPLIVKDANAGTGTDPNNEILQQMLVQLRAIALYLHELPGMLMLNQVNVDKPYDIALKDDSTMIQ